MANTKRLCAILVVMISPDAFAGTWGSGPFDNDTAADWLYELGNSEPGYVVETLRRVSTSHGYIQVDDCVAAIAASEVVAGSLGKPHVSLPESAREWLKERRPDTLLAAAPIAGKAIARCLSMEDSELRQLWAESESFEKKWLAETKGLLERLPR